MFLTGLQVSNYSEYCSVLCVLKRTLNFWRNFAGGLIQVNMGKPRPLEYVAHASFLASLFADYLNSTGVPGWYCGPTFVSSHVLKDFAKSQVRIKLHSTY